MTNELEARLISFAKKVAKGCDICPHKNSSCCVGCYGEEARALARDVDFKPWNSERDERDMTIVAKLSEDKFTPCSQVALDCGMNSGIFHRAAARLVKIGIVEVQGKWIRKTRTP